MESQAEETAIQPVHGHGSLTEKAEARKSLRRIVRVMRKRISSPRYSGPRYKVNLEAFARYIDGGKEAFVEYLRAAMKEDNDEQARLFVSVWEHLTKFEQRKTSLDLIAETCSIPSHRFAGIVAGRCSIFGNAIAIATIASHMGDVATAAVNSAKVKGPKGFKDRELIFTSRGLMPMPKGTQINIQQTQFNNAPDDPGLPGFEDDILDVTPVESGEKDG